MQKGSLAELPGVGCWATANIAKARIIGIDELCFMPITLPVSAYVLVRHALKAWQKNTAFKAKLRLYPV